MFDDEIEVRKIGRSIVDIEWVATEISYSGRCRGTVEAQFRSSCQVAAQHLGRTTLYWGMTGPLDHARIALHHHVTHAQRTAVLV